MFDPASSPDVRSGAMTVAAIADAVRELLHDQLGIDRSTGDPVRHVALCGERVTVQLAVPISDVSELIAIDEAVTVRVRALGATDVQTVIRRPDTDPPPPVAGRGRDPWAGQVRLAAVRHIIAVGAGKGGVGKSTIAVNLALAMARDGLRVGLLDADIYGPSLPILLGIEDGAARARMTPEKHIIPLEAHGLPLVSFGFFLGERSPAIWRGPMVSKAVKQFARGVAWPELDILIVDLPPGTGDVPLSLAQSIALSGAVIVTQPARVATVEARKAGEMFSALGVRVLGVIENMTGPFGAGAGETVSAQLGVAFLGALPFDADIVHEGDIGTPTMIARPDGDTGMRFDEIAQHIVAQLGWERIPGVRPELSGELPASRNG